MHIIIDTSSIIFGFEYKKNVFDSVKEAFPSYKVLISEGIIRELTGIASGKGRKGGSAKIALEAIGHAAMETDPSGESVDAWIIAKAKGAPESIVVTNDTELYKKLKSTNIKCLKLTKSGLLK